MDNLLTPDEAAEFLGVPKQRLATWRMNDEGPGFIRLGYRTVRYRPEDLEIWVEANRFINQGEPLR